MNYENEKEIKSLQEELKRSENTCRLLDEEKNRKVVSLHSHTQKNDVTKLIFTSRFRTTQNSENQ